MSPLSKGSPHSGQNLGALVGSAGCQPHLSHLYWGTPAGFLLPQFWQNFPVFFAPQEQVQVPSSAGRGLPHSGQNLPAAGVPHLQTQPDLGSGFLLPHSGQNFPEAVAPQVHFQLPAGAAFCACCICWAPIL